MKPSGYRMKAAFAASNRRPKKLSPEELTRYERIANYYGENVFSLHNSKSIPQSVKDEINDIILLEKPLRKELAEIVASAVTEWALNKGVTHFTHWFQPLTGATAEKHDSFLNLDGEKVIEKLSASALIQGEPDASSFPNGGIRSTFEARGYTSWDMTSPLFIIESTNGKTLCIPTGFISYHGAALDIKTPLLRSISRLNESASQFLKLTGTPQVKKVIVTCGVEQEYFLIDKAFYYARPDLVMSGRTLFGSLMAKNQQLEDHYFGTIAERVLAFMQELEIELYKMGVPAKTRHNEVAPGQFEIAPIFKEANMAADQNMLMMATLHKVAEKHDFVCLLHEKPFAGINGSGKHLNWSMCDDQGHNLLEPGLSPHENYRFLAVMAVIIEAVNRHADILRMSIASHGNDHRLGANEAPPSIISIFLGDTLKNIFDSIADGQTYKPNEKILLDLGVGQLVKLLKDNTDRNRTSSFAFTGNKFEFRAVGASQAVGFPMSVLNAAVAEVFRETNKLIEADLKLGKNIDEALINVSRHWYKNSSRVVFNGDGYSQDWVDEAKKRGLTNHRTTPEALTVLKDPKKFNYLIEMGVFTKEELETRYNVLLERYIKNRHIEFKTLVSMVEKNIINFALDYKGEIADTMGKIIKFEGDVTVETQIFKNLSTLIKTLNADTAKLKKNLEEMHHLDHEKLSLVMASEYMPLSKKIADTVSEIEELVPDYIWDTPTYFDMIFIK